MLAATGTLATVRRDAQVTASTIVFRVSRNDTKVLLLFFARAFVAQINATNNILF